MYAASDWYHISTRPDEDGVTVERHVHYLDPEKLVNHAREIMAATGELDEQQAVATALGCYADAIRYAFGFPGDWISVPGWSSVVAPGRPEKLIELVGLSDGLPELNCSHETTQS